MKLTRMLRKNQPATGFTVTELMIATTVFSIILILSLTGFLQIGQMFYKGVNITNTTNTAKQVISSLKSDVSFDPDTTAITPQGPSIVTVAGQDIERWWFCAGSNRYTYILGRQVDREAAADQMRGPTPLDPSGWYEFALLKDKVATNLSCPNPFSSPPGSGKLDPDNVTELIGDKMRLSKLEISQLPSPNNKLYTITIKIAYGDDDVLDDFSGPDAKCTSGAASSRYCYVTDIRTTARKGFQP